MTLRKAGFPGEASFTPSSGLLPAPTSCCPHCNPPLHPAYVAAAGTGDGVVQVLCTLPSQWGCCFSWWPLPLGRDGGELHTHLPSCMHEHVFPVPSHWLSLHRWDLDLWGLCVTIEFDSNRLKVSKGCMKFATHLKSKLWVPLSANRKKDVLVDSFPHCVSVGFFAHVPEPLDPVAVFQMAAIQQSNS